MHYGTSLFIPIMTLVAGVVLAQGPTYELGRIATEDEITAWDIAVGPDGRELPAGKGTAREGAKVYAQYCAVCHGPTASEVMYPGGYPPPLVKSKESPVTGHHLKSVTNYWAYATTIWDYINRAMPATSPFPPSVSSTPIEWVGISPGASILNPDQVYALTAFLLYQGGIIGQDEVMDAVSLPKVRMPNRDGFVPADPENWRRGVRLDPHISPDSGKGNIRK